jgi:hypothetical protein
VGNSVSDEIKIFKQYFQFGDFLIFVSKIAILLELPQKKSKYLGMWLMDFGSKT